MRGCKESRARTARCTGTSHPLARLLALDLPPRTLLSLLHAPLLLLLLLLPGLLEHIDRGAHDAAVSDAREGDERAEGVPGESAEDGRRGPLLCASREAERGEERKGRGNEG